MINWLLATACLALAISTVVLLVRQRRDRPVEPDRIPSRRVDRDPAAPLERMDLGVVVLSASLGPITANAAARRLLRLPETTLPVRLESDELLSIARRALNTGEPAETEVNLWPERRRVRARAVEDGDEITIFLADVTEEVQAHQVRRQFVVNASHELKTPVAGIQALAETVNQAIDDDPDAAKRFARKLLIESERLSRLIQDLLDLSRLEDPSHFSDASVDIGAVAEKEAEGLRRLAEDQAIKLEVDVRRDVFIRGDEQQIGLLVRNLIDNAIRYTPPDGNVNVVVARDGGDAILEVEDTGAGIPLNAQSRVFERFFRVDDDRSRGSGGTGLGLSIVKHVTEMHGGHVSLRSELGEGSTFKVRLPLLNGTDR
ncbi:MAG: two-component sensor histidine kinase [Actinobacteria bacterium]|nr:two-component sensor histidine kinase [Actinomycetota bacterium]